MVSGWLPGPAAQLEACRESAGRDRTLPAGQGPERTLRVSPAWSLRPSLSASPGLFHPSPTAPPSPELGVGEGGRGKGDTQTASNADDPRETRDTRDSTPEFPEVTYLGPSFRGPGC